VPGASSIWNLIDFPLANVIGGARGQSFPINSPTRSSVSRKESSRALSDIAAGVSIVLKQGAEFPCLPIPRETSRNFLYGGERRGWMGGWWDYRSRRSALVSSRLVSSRLVSSRLVSSRLVSSRAGKGRRSNAEDAESGSIAESGIISSLIYFRSRKNNRPRRGGGAAESAVT